MLRWRVSVDEDRRTLRVEYAFVHRLTDDSRDLHTGEGEWVEETETRRRNVCSAVPHPLGSVGTRETPLPGVKKGFPYSAEKPTSRRDCRTRCKLPVRRDGLERPIWERSESLRHRCLLPVDLVDPGTGGLARPPLRHVAHLFSTVVT